MFGYVRPYVPELKVSEFEKYRAVYCSVCRGIGKVSGQLSRLGLSYDLVLLCSVRMALMDIEPEFLPFRCPAHVLQKRLVMAENEAVVFTAAVYALLGALKNRDDLSDEHGISRIKPVLLSPLSKHMEKCGLKKLSEDSEKEIEARLGVLSELENTRSPSADDTSDAFGDVLGYIFSLGLEGEKAKIAETIGFHVGKFIYICDAADDLEDDIRKTRYNSFYLGWGDLAISDGKVSDIVKESISTSTRIMLEPLGAAVEKLDRSHVMTPIIKNIVYLGLPSSLSAVLEGREKRKNTTRKIKNL